MRLIYIEDPQAKSNLGGAEVQSRQTADRLSRMGVEIDFTTSDNLNLRIEYDLIHYFNLYYNEKLSRILEYAKSTCIPLVVSPILWDLTDYLFFQSPRWKRIAHFAGHKIIFKFFRERYRLRTKGTSSWKLQKSALEEAQAILPNSHAEKKFLIEWFNLSKNDVNKFYIIPNGVDENLYTKLPQPDLEFCAKHDLSDYILQVGTISPVKNQSGLIEALFDVPIQIVIIGSPQDPSYFEHCLKLAYKRGRTLILDRVPYDELPSIYAASTAHALPSWRETPGLVSLEAGASGSRVITTEIGCTREYFSEDAWYCHPENLLSIRSAIVNALASPIPSGLREKILEKFTWMKAAQITYQVYQDILI